MRLKVEVGVVREEETVWPAEYRTWAGLDDVRQALLFLIGLARRETIAGFRIGREPGTSGDGGEQ